jgi:hypothetical protein
VLDLEEVDDLLDHAPVLELLALRRPDPERLLQEIAAHLQVAPGHDVVEHRHALEERDVLEGARDAERRGLVRVHVREFLLLEADLSLLRVVDAVQAR